jgi:hypothetical protein
MIRMTTLADSRGRIFVLDKELCVLDFGFALYLGGFLWAWCRLLWCREVRTALK